MMWVILFIYDFYLYIFLCIFIYFYILGDDGFGDLVDLGFFSIAESWRHFKVAYLLFKHGVQG